MNRYFTKSLSLLIMIFTLTTASPLLAKQISGNNFLLEQVYDQAKDYHLSIENLEQRIIFYADLLLGIPYGSLAYPENFNSDYSPYEYLSILLNENEFIYSFDRLDCVTYIESALALSYIDNISELTYEEFEKKFEQYLKTIRYHNGRSTFWDRNHFAATEWFPHNNLLFSPITLNLSNNTLVSNTRINRVGWIFKTQFENKFKNFTDNDLRNLLNLEQYPFENEEISNLPYIKIDQANIDQLNSASVIAKWPNISILNIVRVDWDLTKTIGTELNISHHGFVVKKKNKFNQDKLYFLHASSVLPKKTVEIPLTDYMSKFIGHKTIQGINVYSINNTKPVS